MGRISVWESITFGFRTLGKNILFFIGATFVSVLMLMLGFLLSVAFAAPFFLQLIKYVGKFREVFAQTFEALKQIGSSAVTHAQTVATQAGAVDPSDVTVVTGGKVAAVGILQGLKAVWNEFFKAIVTLISESPAIILYVVLGFLIFFVLMVATHLYFYLGWTRVALDFKDKGTSSILSLFSRFSVLFKALLASLLYLIVILLPWKILALMAYISNFNFAVVGVFFFLALILNVYFILKFFFFIYFIVDQNAGPIEALKKSFKLQGAPVYLILLGLALALVFLVFMLPIIVVSSFKIGWVLMLVAIYRMIFNFVSFVVMKLSLASMYRELSKP